MKVSTLFGPVPAFTHLFIHDFPKVEAAQFIFWLIFMFIDKPQLIDMSWGINLALIGLRIATDNFHDFSINFKTFIYLSVLFAYCLRSAGHIFYSRVAPPYKDPRYEDLAKKKGGNRRFYFLRMYIMQGFWIILSSTPLYFLFKQRFSDFRFNNLVGLTCSLIGIIGEAMVDHQLYKNEGIPYREKKEAYRGGLWQKSRHPNLFFSLLNWTGFAISAMDPDHMLNTIWAFIGPLVLWASMVFVTIPASEEQLKKTKNNYEQVIRETNKFIPF